ncbi:MAG: pilus assembly protein PilM [Phycisphaerae bacterium]
MSAKARQKRILAIDWDAHTLRIVHAFLNKKGVKIDRLLSVAVPKNVDPNEPTQIGFHIQQTLRQEGIGTKHAIVDVPRDQAILKTLALPAAQSQDLAGMVEIQIAKELPFPATEAVIDFAASLAPDDSATSDVLVAAIRRELLEQYEASLSAAGLRLDRVGLRPYASKAAVCEVLRHGMPERVLFIDVRPSFMEIDVLRHSALTFSRSASVMIPKGISTHPPPRSIGPAGPAPGHEPRLGATDLADEPGGPERVVRSLMLEVTRSIEAYRQGDPGAQIDHVVIGGDVGVEEALAEEIQRELHISTELYNPATTFGWEPDEGAAASAFAASLGLVLSHADLGASSFDFLHPKKRVSETTQRLRKAPIAAAVALLFLAAGAVTLAGITQDDRNTLQALDKRIAELEGERRDNKKFIQLARYVEAFDADQHVWVDVLYDVFSQLPSHKDLVVNNLEMNQKDGRLTLKTQTRERGTAMDVRRRLMDFRREGHEEPRFRVRVGSQTEKKNEKYSFSQDFRITILDDGPPRKGKSGRGSGE